MCTTQVLNKSPLVAGAVLVTIAVLAYVILTRLIKSDPSRASDAPAATAQRFDDTSASRRRSAAPLPPFDAPLHDTFAVLQSRANNADADAASRLVRDLDRCKRLEETEARNASAALALTRRETRGLSEAQLRTYQAQLDAIDVRRDMQHRDRLACAGVSGAMRATLLDHMAQAARLGDADARACYLARGPLYDPPGEKDLPVAMRAYRSNVKSMLAAGVASGDWRVVDLLQQAYAPGATGPLAGIVGAGTIQHYRYLKLYRLGAESHRVAKLDQQLASAAARLTPDQLRDADAWAESNRRDHFEGASTNATPDGWDACAF